MKKIIIITAMIMGMSTVAQADLKSDLAYINSQAEACIAKQDCEDFILKAEFNILIIGNEDYVDELNKCNPGTKCYARLSTTVTLIMQSASYLGY